MASHHVEPRLRARPIGCMLAIATEQERITMSDYIEAWECIGCGRIEAAQNCIGICQDRKVEFIYAAEHEQTLAELASLRQQLEGLTGFVRRIAFTTPRAGECQRTYRALQQDARRLMRRDSEGSGPG
jgi:hypothetical protein